MLDLTDLQGNNINDFIKNYRDALKAQNEADAKALNTARENAQTSIMSNANRAGLMYSNFPEMNKIKYDTQTYYPALIKAQQSYQTSLDKVRQSALNMFNMNKSIQEAIKELNSL